jgi:hypothetical protein
MNSKKTLDNPRVKSIFLTATIGKALHVETGKEKDGD